MDGTDRRAKTHARTHTHPHPHPCPSKGTDGVAHRDEERAIEYYTRAGAAGHAGALTTLGALFHRRGRYAEVGGRVGMGWYMSDRPWSPVGMNICRSINDMYCVCVYISQPLHTHATKQALDLYQRAGEQGSIEAWRNLASACFCF